MAQDIELELQRVGLSDREAKVYLAALELGPSPVQKIAQRASIPRATVYLVLDELRAKGFVNTYNEGKKTFFVAESPDRLSNLLDERENEIKRQRAAIKQLIPNLMSRGQFKKGERSLVSFYEGPKALKALIRDNLRNAAGGEALGFFSHDDAESMLEKMGVTWDDLVHWRKRDKINRRIIYTWRQKEPPKEHHVKNAKYIPFEDFPCAADISIVANRVAFVPYNDPIRAVAIEDEAVASALRAVFEALWNRS